MYSRGKQLVQIALDKLKRENSISDKAERLLTCNESLSTDGDEAGTDCAVLSDENNNEQEANVLESRNQEMVLNDKGQYEHLDGTYYDESVLNGTPSEEDGGLDIGDKEFVVVPIHQDTHDDTESDDIETYATEINTDCDRGHCSYRVDNSVCVYASNAPDSGQDFDDSMRDEELDLDDSVRDPDYDPRKDKSSDSDSSDTEEHIANYEEIVIDSVDHEEVVTNEPLLKRRRKRACLNDWDRMKQKTARMYGESYKGLKKNHEGKWVHCNEKKDRQMKPRGCSKQCENSKVKRCTKLSENDRIAIFQKFWKTFNWDEKKVYVMNNITESQIKERCVKESTRKKNTYSYFLQINDERFCVCKRMFLNTLGIGEKTAYGWKQTEKKVISEETGDTETRVRSTSRASTSRKPVSDVKTSACEFLTSLPKMESHYCRASSSKHYLEPVFTTKAGLFNAYNEYCSENNVPAGSNCLFYQVFDEMNLSLFSPRKDQCDTCCEHLVGNIGDDKYNEHIKRKDEARLAKAADKERSVNDPKVKVLTMDLQAVLLSPRLQASTLYYKTKLAVHNFTIMDLATKDATCFVWNETEGDLSANSFASCTTDYLDNVLTQNADTEEIVLWSDGCTYQNRNAVLSNALLKIAIDNRVSIVQSFLERGHTQMEVDAIHSLIERKLKGVPIYVPHNYVHVMASCRPSQPLNVKYLDHQFFKDMKGLNFYSSIRPGYKAGDPTVTNLRVLRYNPDGTIQYKLHFSDQYQDFPRRARLQDKPVGAVTQLHSNRIPIKASKFKHLQELKSVIPADYHIFYDSLPHKDG